MKPMAYRLCRVSGPSQIVAVMAQSQGGTAVYYSYCYTENVTVLIVIYGHFSHIKTIFTINDRCCDINTPL